MCLDVDTLRESLRSLRELDSRRVVFGASDHDYVLRPCLDETDIADFERRHSIRLPDDYRLFLMKLGNGGAGPYYGILGLDQLYETADNYTDDLSKPFPYSERWEGPPEYLKAINETEDDDRRDELIDDYWRNSPRHGSIAVCEYGCNLRFLLIIKGAEFGNIWFDQTADLAGYSPVSVNTEVAAEGRAKWCITDGVSSKAPRVNFAEWYSSWLDHAFRVAKMSA